MTARKVHDGTKSQPPTRVHVPDPDRPVVRARRQALEPRGGLERRAPHRAGVPALLFRQRLRARPVVAAGIFRPNFDGIVVRHGYERIFRRVPQHLLDVLRVAVQHRDALEVVPGLDLPDPDALIAAAGGEEGAGRGPCARLDLVLVAFHDGDALPLAALLRPHRGARVEGCGRQESPCG